MPGLEVVERSAPDGLSALPAPDAVFIGGGASDAGVFERCWEALAPGARLVINAVALESQARVIDWYERHGGELSRVCIEKVAALGSMKAFRPALPVLSWSVEKP